MTKTSHDSPEQLTQSDSVTETDTEAEAAETFDIPSGLGCEDCGGDVPLAYVQQTVESERIDAGDAAWFCGCTGPGPSHITISKAMPAGDPEQLREAMEEMAKPKTWVPAPPEARQGQQCETCGALLMFTPANRYGLVAALCTNHLCTTRKDAPTHCDSCGALLELHHDQVLCSNTVCPTRTTAAEPPKEEVILPAGDDGWEWARELAAWFGFDIEFSKVDLVEALALPDEQRVHYILPDDKYTSRMAFGAQGSTLFAVIGRHRRTKAPYLELFPASKIAHASIDLERTIGQDPDVPAHIWR